MVFQFFPPVHKYWFRNRWSLLHTGHPMLVNFICCLTPKIWLLFELSAIIPKVALNQFCSVKFFFDGHLESMEYPMPPPPLPPFSTPLAFANTPIVTKPILYLYSFFIRSLPLSWYRVTIPTTATAWCCTVSKHCLKSWQGVQGKKDTGL